MRDGMNGDVFIQVWEDRSWNYNVGIKDVF